MIEEEDITWDLIIKECHKQEAGNPIAKVFLEVEAELIYLRKTLREIEREN